MSQIRPITDLRNTNEISELCHAKREIIFITNNGYSDLVIMSIETFEEMVENAEIDEAIVEAGAEHKSGGKLLDIKEALLP